MRFCFFRYASVAECIQIPVSCAFASPSICSASINADPLQLAPAPDFVEISNKLDASLVSAGAALSPVVAGIVPKIPFRTAISSFCISLSQNLATKSPIAIIGSAPASAAERSVALHIFARLIIAATSLLEVILLSSKSVPSITCSDSPVKSSKNGMLTVGAA